MKKLLKQVADELAKERMGPLIEKMDEVVRRLDILIKEIKELRRAVENLG